MEKLMIDLLSLLTFEIMVPLNNGHRGTRHKIPEEQYDGPYVQYKDDEIFVNYIMENNGAKILKTDSVALQQRDSLSLKVITDISGKSFQVHLKKKLQNEKSEFHKVKNLMVLSDIEGNFAALRKLLQANKVIDEDF